ncbi:methyltransferase [Microbacterium phage Hendrix]|uniref:Methyltransferase n=1 Tax=Microbacterium phage Hendrix TaxID=2182341 RepID=A0A2U8UUT1_9CAUD|nr:methyltransferase [Microbacterium phage Hendrix]AWN07823.1 methyltransferase [Microbacterium phage Hendrix]
MGKFNPVVGYSRQFTPTLHEEELAWFLEEAPTWTWRWASSFADNAPHSYIVKGEQVSKEIYERAVRVVMALGQPANYYRRVNIELKLPEMEIMFGAPFAEKFITGVKFWPMTNRMTVSKVLNMAPVDMSYGAQTAAASKGPFTRPSRFDFVAADWDDVKADYYATLRTRLWQLLNDNDGFIDSVVELGPTTGYVRDFSLVHPKSEYTIVDGSQGMLNQAIFKHNVQHVVPTSPNEWLNPWHPLGDQQKPHTLVSLFGSASFLKPEAVRWAYEAAREQLVLMHHNVDGHQLDLNIRIPQWNTESRRAAAALPGAYTFQMDGYDVTVVKKGSR